MAAGARQRAGVGSWRAILAAACVLCCLHGVGGIRYYFCQGGDQDSLSCQGLADTITCGTGGTCIEDIYIDPCGNGFRLESEACDDGNLADGDGCSGTCTVERGWTCDGGSSSSIDVCSVVCGDGFSLSSGCCDDLTCSWECNPSYGCDDGNTVAGDGCSDTCSIESGFECWGGSGSSQDTCLCTRNMVSAGFTHTCGVNANYQIECWGNPENNKTKNDFNTITGAFAWPEGIWNRQDIFVTVAAGAEHNCALKFDGFMICWGWIGPSLLGDGRMFLPPAPDWERNSDGGFTWRHVQSGLGFTCGVMDEARFQYRPACKEGEASGLSCAQTSKDRCTGCRPPDDWSTDWLERHPCHLSFVDQATCEAPHNKTALCWGESFYGQGFEFPVRSDWSTVDSGSFHACGVTEGGEGFCWGNNLYGQTKVPAIAPRKWVQITAGGSHSCGIDDLFMIHCWGRGLEGQTAPPCEDAWLRVDAGTLHTCGIRMDTSLVCWGSNQAGQCNIPHLRGNCIYQSDVQMVQVGGGTPGVAAVFAPFECDTNADCTLPRVCEGAVKKDWSQVTAGELHTCGTDVNRNVFCWGSNLQGQSSVPGGTTVTVGTAPNGQPMVQSRGYVTAQCL